jgi:hypothetical protein
MAKILPTCGEVAVAERLTEGAGVLSQRGLMTQPPSTILRAVPLPVPGRNK